MEGACGQRSGLQASVGDWRGWKGSREVGRGQLIGTGRMPAVTVVGQQAAGVSERGGQGNRRRGKGG